MRIVKSTLVVLISLFTVASVAKGQQGKKPAKKSPMIKQQQTVNPDSITDQELKTFAQGMQQARQIQMQARANVKKMVEDEGLTYKRFQQIMMSKRSKKMKNKITVSDEEKAKMDTLRPKIQSANKKARKQIMQAIESTGMSRQRFQQIGKALRTNKKLVKRFKKIQKKMRKEQKNKMKQQLKNKMKQQQNNNGSDK